MSLRSISFALPLVIACHTTPGPDAEPGSTSEIAPPTETEVPVFEVIPLEFADAPELQESLQRLVESATEGADSQVKILTDARTNSLLVMAPHDRMVELKKLIALLDVEQTEG